MCHVQVCTHACLFWVCLGTQVCLSMRRPEVDIYLSSCLSLFPLYLLIRQRAVSVGPSINLSLSKRASANCDSILSGEGGSVALFPTEPSSSRCNHTFSKCFKCILYARTKSLVAWTVAASALTEFTSEEVLFEVLAKATELGF